MVLAEWVYLLADPILLVIVVAIGALIAHSIQHLHTVNVNHAILTTWRSLSFHRAVSLKEGETRPTSCAVAIALINSLAQGVLLLAGTKDSQKPTIALSAVNIIFLRKYLTVWVLGLALNTGTSRDDIPWVAGCAMSILPIKGFTDGVALHAFLLVV